MPSSTNNHIYTIIGISLAVLIASLDTAITNTALPHISQELQTDFVKSIWVVNSYQLVMVALLLPLAVVADQIGYKRIFLFGLIVFIIASLFCGIANSIDLLIIARALQGLGAAAILGTNIALVRLLYTPEKLGLGLGINAFVIAAGLAGGPVLASLILANTTWHWLFLINIPIGILAILGCLSLPSTKAKDKKPINYLSMLLTIVMFASIIYALGAFATKTGNIEATVFLILGVLCLVLLLKRDRKQAFPVFPIDLFQNKVFSLSILTAFLAFVTQGLVLIALPYLFYQMGYSEGQIGFLIAPWPIMGALLAPLAGTLSNKISSAYLGAVGLLLLGSSITVLALLNGNLSKPLIIGCMLICGIGFGLFLTPNQRMLMAGSPVTRSGAAGGMLNVARTFGQAVGAALVAFSVSLFKDTPSIMLWIGASFALMGAGVSFYRKLVNNQ